MIAGQFGRVNIRPKKLAPMSKEASIVLRELIYNNCDKLNSLSDDSDLQRDLNCNNLILFDENSERLRKLSEYEQESKINTLSSSEFSRKNLCDSMPQDLEITYPNLNAKSQQRSKDLAPDELHENTSIASSKMKTRGVIQVLPNKYRHGESNPRGNNSCSDFVSHVDSGYIEGDVESRFKSKRSNVQFSDGTTDDLAKSQNTKASSSDEIRINQLRTGPPSPENFSDIFPESCASSSNGSDRDFRDIIIPVNIDGIDKYSNTCRDGNKNERRKHKGGKPQRENSEFQNSARKTPLQKDTSLSCSNLFESNIETTRKNDLSNSRDFISAIRTHNDIETVGNLTSRTATQTNRYNSSDKIIKTERSDSRPKTKPVISSMERRPSLNLTSVSSDINRRRAVHLSRDESPSTRKESRTQQTTSSVSGPRQTDLKRSSSVPRFSRTFDENAMSINNKTKENKNRDQIENSQNSRSVIHNSQGATQHPSTGINKSSTAAGPGRPGVADSKPTNQRFSALESLAAAAAERREATQRRRDEAARDRELAIVKVKQQGQLEQQQRYWFKVSCVGYDSRFSRDVLPVVEDVDEEELKLEEEYRAIAVSKCEAWLEKHCNMDTKEF